METPSDCHVIRNKMEPHHARTSMHRAESVLLLPWLNLRALSELIESITGILYRHSDGIGSEIDGCPAIYEPPCLSRGLKQLSPALLSSQ